MIDCEFDKYIDLKKLFAKHGITTYTINIGSNGSIYILAGSEYCGIDRERFGVLVLDVDWDDEKLTYEKVPPGFADVRKEVKATKTAEKAEIVAEKAVNRLFGRDESNKNV